VCGLIGGSRRLLGDPDAALARIAHRGPDGQGWCEAGGFILGHTRLAIQDTTEAAAQPFTRAGHVLTYNGELWNAENLRPTLSGPWTSTGDTEVLAALLTERGIPALDECEGMFGLAWSGPDGTWLARDRFGKIPLYAVRTAQGWLWASELRAFPRGSHAVPIEPGTAVHLDTGRVHRWARWQLGQEPDAAQVRTLLREGVAARMVSDRPVCFLLSGGMDSTLVLALARDLHPDPVAYTAVYDPASEDLKAARRVAAEFDVPLVEVKIPDITERALTEAVRTVEVPMKAQVEIATAHLPLARAIASDGFRVALSGEGADELFGGYGNTAIAASKTDDAGYRQIKVDQLAKMARGNFPRVNKVFMAAGVEGRLPFLHRPLVELAVDASKRSSPPGKSLLKAAAAGVIPQWVIRRPKDTFQGGTGVADAAARTVTAPTRFYNAEARRFLGWLPHA
jgi:asparagine synthase (glutamine-hydrolysing)